MKYKVTPRGWVVFSIVGLLLLYGVFASLRWLLIDDSSEGSNPLDNSNNEKVLPDDSINENEDRDDDMSSDTEEDLPDDQTDTPQEKEDDENQDQSESDEENDSIENDEESDEDKLDIPLEEETIIYFDKNIANFEDKHRESLEKWLEWLKSDPSLEITVEGHINGFPYYDDGKFGLTIAKERAQVVKDYFVKNDIDPNRIHTKNMGSTDQAVLTDDLSKHYLNRRAIIYFKND